MSKQKQEKKYSRELVQTILLIIILILQVLFLISSLNYPTHLNDNSIISKIKILLISINTSNLSDFLFKWQSLVGAFMGALIPITVSFFLYSLRSSINFKQGLSQIEKFLVYSINNLYGLREELELFSDRLDKLTSDIEQQSTQNSYYIGTTNFPMAATEHSINIINKSTKSLYLSNKLMRCYSMQRDINLNLTDLREEFRLIVSRNYDVILAYKDPAQNVGISASNQVMMYSQQLKAMKKIIDEIVLKKNIPTAIKSFSEARLILLKYTKSFSFIYRIYYEGFGGSILKKENGQQIIELKIHEEVEKELSKIEKNYKAKK